jgi:N utilization substance protein B
MQAVFAYQLGNSAKISPDYHQIIKELPRLDQIISDNAPKWPLEKINRVDLAILRCALWELVIQKVNPPKVIIDEAVELAKEFGTDSSSSFVNGVMGSAIKRLNIPVTSPPAPHD